MPTQKNFQFSIFNFQFKEGFTLIEIVLALLFIIAIITILFSTSGTYQSKRRGDLQSIAAKIATKQIEKLRNTSFASLPSSGSFNDPQDLPKLPNGSANQTITDYSGDTKIKQVTVTVSWSEGAPRQVKMETLIYEYGI